MEPKVLIGYVLGAAAALGTLIAGWYLEEGFPLTFLVWVTGGILGWITGIAASPQSNEKRDFLKYAKVISAGVAGYLLGFIHELFNEALESGLVTTDLFIGRVFLFIAAFGLGLLFTYVGRRYV